MGRRILISRLLRGLLLGAALTAPPGPVWAVPSAVLLANPYGEHVDVAQYLVSEKLDGVRALWDGKALKFRSGQAVHAPQWFLDALPAQPLDGELWLGRGKFEQLSGMVRRESPLDAEWRQIRYMIFELPDAPGSFAQRAERIRERVAAAGVPWLGAVEQHAAVNAAQVRKMLDDTLAAGGEGLMLHRADAAYEVGRSDTLLKLKPWQDAEARVVGHLPGKGKYAGQLGALRVRLDDGREFNLGTGLSDRQRRNPPPLGTVITFRYRELTRHGVPRFASFQRVRDNF